MSAAGLVELIDALLPQTQCGKCGHPGCQPYAAGIAAGEAHNKCPPGGSATILELSELLGRMPLPLDSAHPVTPNQRAVIREDECIGCTKCIQVCPTDAIVGAARLMHTVIADECSGCELCLAPCPVDCIDLLPVPEPASRDMARQRARHFRRRYDARQARLQRAQERQEAERQRRHLRPVPPASEAPSAPAETSLKSLKIAATMARVALQKAERQLTQYGTPQLAAQVANLRTAASEAQQALDAAQAGALPAPASPQVAPAADTAAALRQARVAATLARAQLAKAERAFGPTPSPEQARQLDGLRAQVQRTAQQLAAQDG